MDGECSINDLAYDSTVGRSTSLSEPVIAQLVERRTVVVDHTIDILRSLVRLRLAGHSQIFFPPTKLQVSNEHVQ